MGNIKVRVIPPLQSRKDLTDTPENQRKAACGPCRVGDAAGSCPERAEGEEAHCRRRVALACPV